MKLVVTEYLSLDAVLEDPIWIAPYIDDSFLKFKFEELVAADALLMGRKTYEYFIPVWASGEPVEDAPGQEGFAARVEQLPKYVVSKMLETTPWNNSCMIRENPVEAVRSLKQQSGQHILVAGSGTLLQSLIQHDLVDEYRFLVFPVMVGQGKTRFNAPKTTALELTSFERFSSGVIAVTYKPKAEAPS